MCFARTSNIPDLVDGIALDDSNHEHPDGPRDVAVVGEQSSGPEANSPRDFSSMSVVSQNVRTLGSSAEKRDEVVHLMDEFNTCFALLQSTGLRDDNTKGKYCDPLHLAESYPNHLFFDHHVSQEKKKVAGGVSIVLGPHGKAAWERAGKPDPIRGGTVAHTARVIGLELHFLDNARNLIRVFAVSFYTHNGDQLGT